MNGAGVAQQPAGARIGAVHIIESLPQGELRTVERLFDHIQPIGVALQPHIETHFSRDLTRGAFMDRLGHILIHLRESQRVPIIHIETHGHFDGNGVSRGFELASGDVVTWADLKPVLTEINVTCCVNVLVVSGSCEGLTLAQIVQPSERAPVWGVLGPSRIITAGELEDAHFAFYRTLYATRDYGPAVRSMNDSVGTGDRPFFLFGAEMMFREVMRGYFQRYCDDDSINARVHRTAATEQQLRDSGVPEDEILRSRQRFRDFLCDHRGHFDRFKPLFFAIDLCPSNSTRFSLSFEDCQPTQ